MPLVCCNRSLKFCWNVIFFNSDSYYDYRWLNRVYGNHASRLFARSVGVILISHLCWRHHNKGAPLLKLLKLISGFHVGNVLWCGRGERCSVHRHLDVCQFCNIHNPHETYFWTLSCWMNIFVTFQSQLLFALQAFSGISVALPGRMARPRQGGHVTSEV